MKSYHLCKEDYEEVKQRLSMRQVAEHYGGKVKREVSDIDHHQKRTDARREGNEGNSGC